MTLQQLKYIIAVAGTGTITEDFATGIDNINHFFDNADDFNEFINSDEFQPILPD